MSKLFQPLIDKWEKWNRNRKYPKDKYFRYVVDGEMFAIELLQGPYKGVMYTYGHINIDEDLGYKGANASFDFNVINADLTLEQRYEYCNDSKLGKIVGQILLNVFEDIIKKQAETFAKENLNEEVREDYFEEPVPQRTVRKKNPSVSKKRVSTGKKRKSPVRRGTKVRPPLQPDSHS